ncbi:hypothetical protein [Mesomycoplasma ovipneumoniae]|uniref:hypothetical protein n=1 Tax=Mesomycoplasma ovipneumoniae TaxID=29562 RepID=UPI0030802550
MMKIKGIFKRLILPSLTILSPFLLFSQKSGDFHQYQNSNFDFKELASNLNFDANLNKVNRNVKVGVFVEENGDENNNDFNNLQAIFQFFAPNSNLIIYRFKTGEQWNKGLSHFETVGVEMVLHLYKEKRTFLNEYFSNGRDLLKLGDFLDYWSGKTGIINFFDGSRTLGDEINSNFSFFAKQEDRFKKDSRLFNYVKNFGNSAGIVKSNHFILPELKFAYQLNIRDSNIKFYSAFLLSAIFSALSSSFGSYESLKERNLKIISALSLTGQPSENSNLGFNGTHSSEGFGFINYKHAYFTLEQGNYLYNNYDGNEYVSEPFELLKGQKFSALVFNDRFSEKEVVGEYLSGFSGFFYNFGKTLRDGVSNLLYGQPNYKTNDFDISIEIYRGSWQKIIEANSDISPFDKISFKAFEDAQYRIRVSNVNFQPDKPKKYFLTWRRYPAEFRSNVYS